MNAHLTMRLRRQRWLARIRPSHPVGILSLTPTEATISSPLRLQNDDRLVVSLFDSHHRLTRVMAQVIDVQSQAEVSSYRIRFKTGHLSPAAGQTLYRILKQLAEQQGTVHG